MITFNRNYTLAGLLVYLSLFIASCTGNSENEMIDVEVEAPEAEKISITDVTIPGGYLLQDLKYVKMVGKIEFTVEVGVRQDSTISLKFNFYQPLSFAENYEHQRELLAEIVKDHNALTFRSVHLGRLIYTGDLCLKASTEVLSVGWDGSDYPALKSILDTGAIVNSYRPLFEEYGVNVSGVSFEKAFLTESSMINQYASISLGKEEFPPKVLDAITWLILE